MPHEIITSITMHPSPHIVNVCVGGTFKVYWHRKFQVYNRVV